MPEDREDHTLKSILTTAATFTIGYNLKKNYLKNLDLGFKNSNTVFGIAFSAIPILFNEDLDTSSALASTALFALASTNKERITKKIINNTELFEGTITNLTKLNQTQKDIKEFFLESKQKLLYERKKDQSFSNALLNLSREVFDKISTGKKISKSKAYYKYNSLLDETDNLTFEELERLSKKVPYEYFDYIKSRREFEKRIGNINTGSGLFTTLGYFSKINKNGKLELDALKFLENNSNNVINKIEILDTMPKTFTSNYSIGGKTILAKEFNKKGLDFFNEALEQGEAVNRNQVTYKEFMDKYGEELFFKMGAKANKYFDSEGNARYINILGNQVFSDNILKNDKGKMLDATWLKPTNYALDAMKLLDKSLRPFFKNLPFSENKQFPIFDTFNLETKIYNSIYSNPMSKIYVDKTSNVDLNKTKYLLEKQINNMKLISNPDYRAKNGYKSISQALFVLNKTYGGYNPKIKNIDQLNKSIKLLEYKSSVIDDLITKTGGTLEKSSLIGYSKDMDKSYYTYFINVNKGKVSLLENTNNNLNSIFYNNKMYIKNNGKFIEQNGQYVFDLSRQTRIIQSKRNRDFITTRANKVGRYIEAETAPENFDFNNFKYLYETKGLKNALRYARNSDLNFIPGYGRNGYKDSDNLIDSIKEPFEKINKYRRINQKENRDNLDILNLFLGIEKQNRSFYTQYNSEINQAFDKMLDVYKKGISEISNSVSENVVSMNRLKKITGISNIRNPERIIPNLSSKDLTKIINNIEMTDNAKTALKMQQAFEMSTDKYKLVNDYKNILQVGTKADIPIQKKLGDLFNSNNFKEDIIINTFAKENDYREFEQTFGDLFENNIMFSKETLFNKNRITNINAKKPSIVKRAFTGLNLNGSIDDLGKSVAQSLIGNDKLGTNLGMFLTKGFESFENTLSVLGVPKLNPENMKNTTEYFSAIFSKRILPFYAAAELYGTLNSAVDAILPDSTPIFGQGITAAAFKGIATIRMAIQIAINGIGLGAVFRKVEEMFPGMLTDNGLLSPLQLSYTNEDMYAMLFEGKEIEDKKNRFWYSSGRQKFEGGEVANIRPHLLYLGQHRTSGIYENKMQRFFRQDFLPTKILWTAVDPYMEERINEETRPVAKSGDVFNTEIPIFGGFVNLLGKIIKPTKYFNKEEWYIKNGIMKNPNYDGQENTQEFLYYDTTWKSTEAVSKMYEDLKSIMGMRGYIFGQGLGLLFGKDNESNDRVKLETLNDGQSMLDRYNDLNLGGMFGTTEPIRRLLGNKATTKNISPIRNNSLPDWIPKNYFKNVSFGNVYDEIPFGEFVLPGKVYEQYNKLHSDDTGRYGVADRLKILSKIAPFSKEFRHTRLQALSRLPNMSVEEKQIVYQSLSYADRWRNRDISKNNNQIIDTEDASVTIKRIDGPFEFYGTDNKRYKIAGLSLNFFDGRNNESITNEMEEFQSIFKRGSTLRGVIASDPLTSVKTDNAGEYIEIYFPQFDKFRNLKEDTYLRTSYDSDFSVTTAISNLINNAKKPASLEKIWGNKDTYYRYYYENILDPAFKNWEYPIESFVSPIFDTASTGLKGYISSMNTSIRLGDFGDPVMPALTTGAFIKGMILGPNSVNRIERENYLKDLIEFSKSQLETDDYRGNFNSSIYNISKNDGLSKMKNYLTNIEKKYLDDIANEVNPELRQKMYDVSSDRMKIVLNNLWERQAEYNGGSYEHENIKMKDYSDEDIAEYNSSNDVGYNDALFKLEMGFDLTTYEEQTISLFGTTHLKEYKRDKNIAEYIDRLMGKGNKQKVLSTTMGEDMLVFTY